MKLTIRAVGPSDFGSYKCVSKNSLGDTDGSIKLYREYIFVCYCKQLLPRLSVKCYECVPVGISYLVCAVFYCHMWPVWLYHTFPHYPTKDKVLGEKKVMIIKCVFWFYLQFLSETFLILRRIQRYFIVNVFRFSYKAPFPLDACQILIKIESSQRILEKSSNVLFY